MSRTQSIIGVGTPRMGEAGAIGSPIIQESKAKERKEEEEEEEEAAAYGRSYIAYGSRVACRASVSAHSGP